jgi:membrane protein YqaA with SNARE-associated domain
MSGLVNWVVGWAHSPSAITALFLIAFAESSFFPIPPDVLLIAMALIRPEEAFYLALVCGAGSVLGGVFGYFLGWLGGRPLLHKLFAEHKIKVVRDLFEKYEVWAIGIAGFTPVPYKIFTVSAGTFEIPFKPFVAISAVSRSARFFLVAAILYIWGEEAKYMLEHHFKWITIAFMVLFIGGFLVFKPVAARIRESKHQQPAHGPGDDLSANESEIQEK